MDLWINPTRKVLSTQTFIEGYGYLACMGPGLSKDTHGLPTSHTSWSSGTGLTNHNQISAFFTFLSSGSPPMSYPNILNSIWVGATWHLDFFSHLNDFRIVFLQLGVIMSKQTAFTSSGSVVSTLTLSFSEVGLSSAELTMSFRGRHLSHWGQKFLIEASQEELEVSNICTISEISNINYTYINVNVIILIPNLNITNVGILR